jgi:hypothetical protein
MYQNHSFCAGMIWDSAHLTTGDLVERHSFEGLQIPGVRLFANGGQWHLPPKIVCR